MAQTKSTTPDQDSEDALLRKQKKAEYNARYLKEWRKKNPDYMKNWRKGNSKRREYMKKYQSEWYLKNRERLLPEYKRYRESLDREKVNAYLRAWGKADRAKNPEKARLKLHARRTKTNGIIIVKEEIHNWESRICGICETFIDGAFHIDHITPLSRGGPHEVSNLQLAHPLCNWRKNNKLPEEMAKEKDPCGSNP